MTRTGWLESAQAGRAGSHLLVPMLTFSGTKKALPVGDLGAGFNCSKRCETRSTSCLRQESIFQLVVPSLCFPVSLIPAVCQIDVGKRSLASTRPTHLLARLVQQPRAVHRQRRQRRRVLRRQLLRNHLVLRRHTAPLRVPPMVRAAMPRAAPMPAPVPAPMPAAVPAAAANGRLPLPGGAV